MMVAPYLLLISSVREDGTQDVKSHNKARKEHGQVCSSHLSIEHIVGAHENKFNDWPVRALFFSHKMVNKTM